MIANRPVVEWQSQFLREYVWYNRQSAYWSSFKIFKLVAFSKISWIKGRNRIFKETQCLLMVLYLFAKLHYSLIFFNQLFIIGSSKPVKNSYFLSNGNSDTCLEITALNIWTGQWQIASNVTLVTDNLQFSFMIIHNKLGLLLTLNDIIIKWGRILISITIKYELHHILPVGQWHLPHFAMQLRFHDKLSSALNSFLILWNYHWFC